MAEWPNDTSIDAFRERWTLEGEPLWRSVFEMHRDKMQIKNAFTATSKVCRFQFLPEDIRKIVREIITQNIIRKKY